MAQLSFVLGTSAAVLLVAVLGLRVSTRLGLPSLLLYLGIGVALGESGIGIKFDNAQLTQSLGIAALVLILTEGGLTTRWQAGTGRLAPDGAGGIWVTADDGSDSVVGHWPWHGRLNWTGLQHG